MSKIRHLSLRIDDALLAQFRSACAYYGRSANSQLLQYIRGFVDKYEAQIQRANGKQGNEHE
nr:hypothetical protein [Maliibacterium massiliense]